MAAFCWELPETELWNQRALGPSTPQNLRFAEILLRSGWQSFKTWQAL